MQNLPVSSDALILHCLPFLMPYVRMRVQDTTGVQPVAGGFFVGSPGDVSLALSSSELAGIFYSF